MDTDISKFRQKLTNQFFTFDEIIPNHLFFVYMHANMITRMRCMWFKNQKQIANNYSSPGEQAPMNPNNPNGIPLEPTKGCDLINSQRFLAYVFYIYIHVNIITCMNIKVNSVCSLWIQFLFLWLFWLSFGLWKVWLFFILFQSVFMYGISCGHYLFTFITKITHFKWNHRYL